MIYVVFGIHRSGTSVVANLLHDAGIPMGESFAGPARENPKGFWEDKAVRKLNDQVLAECGYNIKAFVPRIPPTTRTRNQYERAIEIVTRRAHLNDWGFKDPRLLLTMQLWEQAIHACGLTAKLIVTIRNPYSVSRSLMRRGNIANEWVGLRLYAAYMERQFEYLAHSPFPYCFVQYENLLHDLQILESFTGHRMNPQIVDPKLDRENYTKVQAS